MEIPLKHSNQGPWLQFLYSLLEDWREETLPERDGLLGETTGDNVRHVIVRAAFMDCFFQCDLIREAITTWVQRPPLKQKFQHMSGAFFTVAELAGISWEEIGWDENAGIRTSSDGDDPLVTHAVAEANESIRSLFLELRSFSDSETFQTVVGEAIDVLESLDLPYQWLAIELVQVYFANLLVDDFSWQYEGRLVTSTPTVQAPEFTYEFSTREGETSTEAIDRIRQEVEWCIELLGRYQQPLQRGSLPELTQSTLRRDARWFFLHKVAKRSIRSIALEAFVDDGDRRKDVREGITRAGKLLDLGRGEISYGYQPRRPVWRP